MLTIIKYGGGEKNYLIAHTLKEQFFFFYILIADNSLF